MMAAMQLHDAQATTRRLPLDRLGAALARGEAAGRRTAGERTVLKSVVTALEDLAAAVLAWEGPST